MRGCSIHRRCLSRVRETTNDNGPLWNRAARLVSSVQRTEENDEQASLRGPLERAATSDAMATWLCGVVP